ncbi:tryptophan synthase subunit alpha [Celeribacter sp. ULVN23_4]
MRASPASFVDSPLKRQDGNALLSCYFPLGDPEVPVEMIDVYAEQGVDVLEIGLASSYPFMDGADVRASMARADRARSQRDLEAVLERLARHRNAPKALLMCYADADHPAHEAPGFWQGLDSCLIVAQPGDPLAQSLRAQAVAAGVAPSEFIGLPLDDAALTAGRASSFYVMLQAGAGLTGPRRSLDPDNRGRIDYLRAGGVSAPILLGFGISNGTQAKAARALGADGIIVGSQVLRATLQGARDLAALLKDLRGGLDA